MANGNGNGDGDGTVVMAKPRKHQDTTKLTQD